MINDKQYPRFILDKPIGEDVFEGKSQTHLANNICEYIRSNDSISADKNARLPRIIGLEGCWGSGKSNVVKQISNILGKEGYYTFTYDTWGHQEDLQRRSILETLTNTLIEEKVLDGKVTIKMRNGQKNSEKWENQLSLLLSNKTTTITKSQPKLSWSAMSGIILIGLFAVLTSIIGQIPDKFPGWIIVECIPIIIGALLVIGFGLFDKDWKRGFTLLTQKDDSKVDEQFTSSEEPSVVEFKNWMHAISTHLGKAEKNAIKKVIIVFDNMDRLPSEKVIQLWSAIYTFFAGSDFENIWTIIPYDNKHLCEAIYDRDNNKEITDKFKCFINKTFPIVYTVPQPVITDYNKLFNKYFIDAFGEEEHDQNHICQVFMLFRVNPNPRTVIAFINELVAMRLQWPDEKYRLQNIALFVLKKDKLLYEGNSLDENLLSDTLFEDISYFYPDQELVRTQLCQFAYGLQDESLAGELPLRRLLVSAIKTGRDLKSFLDKPYFISVLEDLLAKEATPETLDYVVRSMSSLEMNSLPENEREKIQKKWDMLANIKSGISYNTLQFDDTLETIIYHATNKRVKDLCKTYVNAMQKCEISTGSDYFSVLNKLKTSIENSEKGIIFEDIINYFTLTPNHFVEFVIAAGEKYNIYKVNTDNKILNQYIFAAIKKDIENIDKFVELVYQDSSFDFTDLRTSVYNFINNNIGSNDIKGLRVISYVNRLLDKGDDIIKSRFINSLISQTIQKINAASTEDIKERGIEDIFVMSLADGHDIANINKEIIPRMASCFEKYMDYSDLIKHLGSQGSAYRLLNIYIIKNKLGGNKLDVKYAIQNIKTIKQTLALDDSEIFSHFNQWDPEWSDEDEATYASYCSQELFETYKEYPGLFTNGIIDLGVRALKNQPKGFLYSPAGGLNAYWCRFVQSFLGTKFLPEFTNNLYEELKSLLDKAIAANKVEYPDLLNTLLSSNMDSSLLTSYLHDKLNNNFSKTRYQSDVFKVFGKLLPQLGPNMDDNTARGIISNFIAPFVNDVDCAQIIIAHKEFYMSILEHCKEMSQDILKSMKNDTNVKEVYSPIAEDIDKLIIPNDKVTS